MQTATDVPGPSDPRLRNPDEAWKRKNMVWTRIYYGRAVMEHIIDTIDVKHALQKRYSYRYVMRAAMAGVIVALLYFFAYQVKADLGPAFNPGLAKYLTAASFSLALVLIYFTNSELLTSNFMYFTVGLYYGKIRARSTLTVLGLCLLGNLLGVVAIGLLARSAGMLDLAVRREILHTVTAKTVESGIWLIFVKAIFANYFINVAVIISMQVQEHLAKIAALLMGVTIFAYMGYEHVIANAALFATALLFDPGAVSPLHVGKNLLVSLVGNYVGGGLVIGLFYAYLNDDRRDAASAARRAEARAIRPASLLVAQVGDAGQLLALEELEGGAAAGGDVGDLVGEAVLLDGRDRVAAADDRDGAVRRGVGQRLRDRERALRPSPGSRRRPSGRSRRTVFAPFTISANFARVASPMSTPMSFGPIWSQRHRLQRPDLAGVEVEGVGHDGVDGQDQLVAGLGEQRPRHLDAVVLDQRAADLLALRLVEREGHAAADDRACRPSAAAPRSRRSCPETLAPPMIATNGRFGLSTASPRKSSSFFIR